MNNPKKEHFFTAQVGIAVDRLRERGINPALLFPAMAGDVDSIDLLSQALLARELDYQAAKMTRERRRISKSRKGTDAEASGQSMGLVRGEGHLALSVAGFLITLMIEACVRRRVAPPAALAQLVRVHLGADTFAAQELKAPDAFDRAAQYRLAYPDASQGEIARHAGVSRPLVSEWIKTGSLKMAVERLARLAGAAELIRNTTPRA